MTFSTSLGATVVKKTIGAFAIFTLLPLFNLFHSDNWIWYVSLFAFFMLVLLFTYLHKPSKYEVDKNGITIHRPIGNVRINIADIEKINRIHHDLLAGSFKGGAFGYFGKFNTDLGELVFYATRRNKLVMIAQYDKTKIVLTPDQQEAFIEEIEMKVNSQCKSVI